MKVPITIVLFVLSLSTSLCQDRPVQIYGTVNDINSAIPAPNVQIYLLKENDTLSLTNTDSLGQFFFETNFSNHVEYSLQHNFNGINHTKIIIQNAGDSILINAYEVEISIFTSDEDKFDNSAYFDLNETRDCQNFEPVWFSLLMKEYPNMCMEFTQLINPQEGTRVAQKRMTNFRKMLSNAGCDMSRISFTENTVILNESLLKIDSRSRIQGLVLSMDGDCN